MWLNCSRTRVSQGNVGKVVEILAREASLAPIRSASGFRGLFLVESTEAPGKILSITWWESAEDGQAYLASPACQEVIDGIQPYLTRPLERYYYEVLIEATTQKDGVEE